MPQLAQIIEFQDPVGDVLAARLPASGEGVIEWGSQLIVREGQIAVFFRDGKAMATFEPGRYVLTTQNVPVLTKFVTGMVYGKGNTPFRAEVYYVSSTLFRDLKWGTPEPVYIPDPILMQIPIRANGRFAIRISDPSVFVPKVVGTRPIFRARDIEDFLRAQYIVAALTDGVASLNKSFAELPRYYRDVGIAVKAIIAPEVATLGIEMTELAVNSVSTTEEIRQVLDRNAGIASEAFAKARGTQWELEAKAAGAAKLAEAGTSYQQVGMADAMKTMAANPGQGSGGGGGTAMDTGVNLGLAMMMPQMMNQMLNPGAQPGTAGAPGAAVGVTAVATPVDPFAKIKQLKELVDMGAISKEEFEAKKAELLKSI